MREVDQALDEYLRNFATLMAKAPRRNFKYSSIFDLLVREGRLFNPDPYTSSEKMDLLEIFKYLSHKPLIKQCFYNSQALALDGSLGYAEGQVLNAELPVPLEHGWNFINSGKVVDLTLRPYGEKDTRDPAKLLKRAIRNQKNAYIGLPFPSSLIRKAWFDTHQALMLLEYHPVQKILFEEGYPEEWRKPFQNFPPGPSLSGLYHGSSSWIFSAEPSPLELGDPGYPSWKIHAMPSPREHCAQGAPSWNFSAEPSRRASSDRYTGAVMKNTAAEPWLSGPRPEEEWLNEPEREGFPPDETRSPFEGDIPPWAQRGYKGQIPMRGKIFYITAYVGSGPERLKRVIKPSLTPVLGAARPVKDVGQMPAGVQFGSEFMFFPFAAIPARREDLAEIGPVVAYLEGLIEELGAFGKILLEESFPSVDQTEVRLQNGRWFPVSMESRLFGGISYLNAYNVNRLYGGPEEGGWWFDAGDPVASVPLREEDAVTQMEWEGYLKEKVAWSSKYDRGSVLGHDDFEIRHEDQFAAPFPTETPRYE